MDWYKSVNYFYQKKLWNEAQVWDAVSKEKITDAQYTEITGNTYPTERPIVA
ncbi:XkdX family protein [Virgibacillus halodenitrificans]|uniref:XkdX family protein n=1 Tax=Virgibacillus halodenitrificans TaxID=1482 RepID=UPI001F32F2AA|nr:XkdX family protein [Virgibacillus halodenitrificans]MCG1029322.1 XkdX family protein [Virgibacillus halodenitrificans]